MTGSSSPPRYWQMPGHLIRRLHQLSTQVFLQQVSAAGYDLTPVQFAALDALADRPGADQATLASAIAKDRATIGAVVDRLQQKGLLHRVVSGRDKRARDLCLSDEGARIVAELRPLVTALQADILPGLTQSETEQFIQLATKAARLEAEAQK
jgi:DNA-binding MarR family transcriptional regulator